ncbi:MAG: YjhX family toxin [Proteobacteria bacterium]|nr:YjhX family toxin [Pseudomonadota bacterium]
MNVSRDEQRVLHVLAQGGHIAHHREDNRIIAVDCFNRDGHRLVNCRLDLFAKLKRKGLIASKGGGPYRITLGGLRAVRAQLDNR